MKVQLVFTDPTGHEATVAVDVDGVKAADASVGGYLTGFLQNEALPLALKEFRIRATDISSKHGLFADVVLA